jgi:hypothetical protein
MTNKKQPPNNDNNKQRTMFNFFYHPYSDTVDGKLITYLRQKDGVRSSKEMVLQALRMCWLPLAYKALINTGVGISEQEVRRVGLICCHALEQHLAYLRMELGLPDKSNDVLPVPLSTITNPQTLAAMFGLDVSNFTINDDSSNEDEGNSDQANNQIDSDSFIPGKGSFHDDDDDMFADI